MLTSAVPLRFPCAIEAQFLARQVLLRSDATSAEISLAIETLETSKDWRDLELARRTREAMRANARIFSAECSMLQERQSDNVLQASGVLPATNERTNPQRLKLGAGLILAAVVVWAIGTAAAVSIQNSTAQAAVWRSTH